MITAVIDSIATLSLSAATSAATLADLPEDVLYRIAIHLRDFTPSANPQADLAAFAGACKSVAAAVIPSVMYSRLQLPSLASLYSLESTLRLNTDLASHVKVLILSPEFMDWYQYDLEGGLGEPVKYNNRGSVPCALRLPFLGAKTERSLLMAWLTTIAELCPNLVGVDFGPVGVLPKTLTIGFANLAQILRPRRGWFKSPSKEGLAVSSILMSTPVDTEARIRGPMLYVVTGIDWGRKVLDVETIQAQAAVMSPELNLCQIEVLVPGGHEELARWRVDNLNIFDDLGQELPYSEDFRDFALARQKPFVFDLKKQRLLIGPTAPLPSSSVAPNKSLPAKSAGKGKGNKNKNKKATASPRPAAAKSAAAPTRAAGKVTLQIGTLDDVLAIMRKHDLDPSECVNIKSFVDLPPSYHPSHERIITSRTFALRRCLLEPLSSSPWTSVAALDFGPPLFTDVNHQESLELLAPLARAFPNLNRLVIRSNDSCVADILLAVDPFVRRQPDIGPPLRELGVMRLKGGLGCSTASYGPPAVVKRTALNKSTPTRGHLRSLFISVHVERPNEIAADRNKIMIHPSLAMGLESLNMTGVRMLVAPASCAGPTDASFPLFNSSFDAFTGVVPLERATLPNVRRLHLSFIMGPLPPPVHPSLPACPQLEALVLEVRGYPQFQEPQHVIGLLEKYPKLRNAAITSATLTSLGLAQVSKHLFPAAGSSAADARPLPRLARLIVRNYESQTGQHNADAVGLWSMGTVAGSLRITDVPLIDSSFKLAPSLASNNDWIGPKGQVTQGMIVPSVNTPCVCKKQVMGKVWQPGSKLVAWAVPTVSRGVVVVCKSCVDKATDDCLKVNVLGNRVPFKNVRRLARGVVGPQEMALHMGPAIWPLYVTG